jgi:hypothetical protein
MKYIVKSVVCDYGVFEKTDNGEQLKVICNSLSNAELIADIHNTDLENTKYAVIKKSEIDKAIDRIKGLSVHANKIQVLRILQECIGE